MSLKQIVSKCLRGLRATFVAVTVFQFSLGGPLAGALQAQEIEPTRTPIKHVIVIVGENRTFDHLFATYKPKHGESVDNLLAKGIVNEDGTPGPNYSLAAQFAADATDSNEFQLSPNKKTLYSKLPAPLNGGPTDVCKDNGICTLGDATSSENGLDPNYYQFLLTGGSGLSGKVPDTRINGAYGSAPYSRLPSGPFQLTNSNGKDTFTWDSYAASPVHRFYQMWQQFDCNATHATHRNPSGCLGDLFTWTEVTVGSNVNGVAQPSNFSTDYSPTAKTTGEGATAMGFYNVLQGDMPYFKELADHYSMSDNYHQPVMGGTGANSIMLGFGDAIWFSDTSGAPAQPPHNEFIWSGTPDAGTVDEIENPNPVSGTNNWWTQDGYGGGGFGSAVHGGGSYSNCSDPDQPGVGQIRKYLGSLARPIKPNCEEGHYYLLNNYNPGYFGDGSNAYTDHFVYNTPFTIPGTNQRSIADVLLENHVSWKSYNDQWNQYLTDKYQLSYGTVGPKATSIATSATRSIIRRRSWPTMPFARPTSLTPPISTVISPAAICPRSPTSSPAAGWTVIQLHRSSISSKATSRRSSMPSRATRNSGRAPRSSSPWMKAAATMTLATSSRSISSVTEPVFLSSWLPRTAAAATFHTPTQTTSRF